jgi:hypothetical protein
VIADKAHSESADFRQFRRQLFHASLATIFSSLKPGMTIPEVVLCPDGHFRLILWELGPYIADYPEQVLLCCIVQGWCPKYVFFQVVHYFYFVTFLLRCRASPGQLDNRRDDTNERRSRDHTDFLATRCEMRVLYDNYGIIGNIIVCIL